MLKKKFLVQPVKTAFLLQPFVSFPICFLELFYFHRSVRFFSGSHPFLFPPLLPSAAVVSIGSAPPFQPYAPPSDCAPLPEKVFFGNTTILKAYRWVLQGHGSRHQQPRVYSFAAIKADLRCSFPSSIPSSNQ